VAHDRDRHRDNVVGNGKRKILPNQPAGIAGDADCQRHRGQALAQKHQIGGVASDYATRRRIEGFSDVVRKRLGGIDEDQVAACGYEGDLAEQAIRELYTRLRGLPRALFVNSTIALEGVVRFLKTLPADERIAWTLRYVDHHRLEVVAKLVDCSLATAKRRILRAQRFLNEHFVPAFAEGE